MVRTARHRRTLAEAIIGLVLGAIAVSAIWTCTRSFLPHARGYYPSIPTVNSIGISPAAYTVPAAGTPGSKIGSVPVLTWHQMDNGCAPTAATCDNPKYSANSVTQRQFYDQMSWLHSHGYQTVTARQYVSWATGGQVMLPAKPVLLTADDGIANFYAGATPALQHFGYTMVSMVASGFAQGAQDGQRQYKGWDATWTQLSNLPSGTWEFAFHAGPAGHVVASGTDCPYFYPCQRPAEAAAAYQARAAHDDAYLDSLAAQIRDYGHDVVVSWAPEANGNWNSWGAPQTPVADYRAAWAHVMSRFTGAPNVTWMATINRTYASAAPTRDYVIPGVDMYGIDAYFTFPGDTFQTVFGETIAQIKAVTDKPIMASETRIGPVAGQVRSIPGLIAGARAYHLAGVVYLNENQGTASQYHQDWRLSPAAMKALRAALIQGMNHS